MKVVHLINGFRVRGGAESLVKNYCGVAQHKAITLSDLFEIYFLRNFWNTLKCNTQQTIAKNLLDESRWNDT